MLFSHKGQRGLLGEDQNMSRYTLYYAPDNASLIIRLALDTIGVAYEAVLVNRATREQASPAYLRLNPHGLIPVLDGPDGPIFETAAILLWLGDRHQGLCPAPQSPQRADFLKWLFFVSNTVHPALRMIFYPEKYAGPDHDHQRALRATAQASLQRHFAALDARAAEAPFALAIQVYLAAMLRWCALYPADADRSWFDLTNTPHLLALCVALEQTPATAAAQTAEGLGPTPFSAPIYATPSKGSAI